LTTTARVVGRAFDDALAAVSGSRSTWLILLSLKMRQLANQRELAEAVGIEGATLTHHLDAMESDGLITRRRDPSNRRVHVVEVTQAGDAAFVRMRSAAAEFDRRLRAGISDAELAQLRALLARLEANAAPTD
jgi:MarR family transcriptional regulator for hemolysin